MSSSKTWVSELGYSSLSVRKTVVVVTDTDEFGVDDVSLILQTSIVGLKNSRDGLTLITTGGPIEVCSASSWSNEERRNILSALRGHLGW